MKLEKIITKLEFCYNDNKSSPVSKIYNILINHFKE